MDKKTAENFDIEDYKKYGNEYDGESLKQKIKNVAVTIGSKVVEQILFLYYLITDEDSPIKPCQKALIMGVLGYFILPVDIIPDFIVGLGYADDAAIIYKLFSIISDELKKPENLSKKYEIDQKVKDYLRNLY